MSYRRIAPFYDFLARVVFGHDFQLSKKHFLDKIEIGDSVLIIGGGISGLSCAKALELKGFEVTLCEQTPEFNSVGAGITLWPNALLSLRNIDKNLEKNIINSGFHYSGGSIRTNRGRILSKQNLSNLFLYYLSSFQSQ